MRTDILRDRLGWIRALDYKKLILIALLSRLIFASVYDISVSTTGRDVLLPDGKFYSMYGLYISLLASGYDKDSMPADALPPDAESRGLFLDILNKEGGKFPPVKDETDLWLYFMGFIYFLFGYFLK